MEEPAGGRDQESSIVSNMAAQLQAGNPEDRVCGLQSLANLTRSGSVRQLVLEAGLAIIKNPPKKKQNNPPKKPTKNVFLGFFKFLIFYDTNFSLWNRFFYEQIRHKLSFIYKKILRYALN